MAVIIAFEAIGATAISLDLSNILLLWIVLAFVGGAAVGFFTEDARPGRYGQLADPVSKACGAIWGVVTIIGLRDVLRVFFQGQPWPVGPHVLPIAIGALLSIDMLARVLYFAALFVSYWFRRFCLFVSYWSRRFWQHCIAKRFPSMSATLVRGWCWLEGFFHRMVLCAFPLRWLQWINGLPRRAEERILRSQWWIKKCLRRMLLRVLLLVFSRQVAKHSTGVLRRSVSNLQRSAVRIIAILGWFAIVQFPDTMRITIVPNVPLVVNLEQFLVWVIAGVAMFVAIYAIGRRANILQQNKLWAEFEEYVPAHYNAMLREHEINVNSLALAKRSALITEFLVKMGLGHWADAKKSLDLMRGVPNVN
jgi:hypothetical protein